MRLNSDVTGDLAVINLRSSAENKEILTFDDIWIAHPEEAS